MSMRSAAQPKSSLPKKSSGLLFSRLGFAQKVAKQTKQTLYQVKNNLFTDFLKMQLKSPTIQAI